MKNIKSQVKLSALVLALISLSACNAASDNGGGYYYNGKSYNHEYTPSMGAEQPLSSGVSEGETQSSKPTIRPGQLTCSAVNDNDKYDYWRKLSGIDNQDTNPQFYSYYNIFGAFFNSYNRIKLTIKNGNDISVRIKNETNKFYVDNTETAYLFPKTYKEEQEVEINYLDKNGERATYSTTVKDNDVIDLENDFTLPSKIEIMFVVDSTGSMSDEMNYIKSEIIDVIGKVKTRNPDS
ncbi:MAG: hypothetical protein J5666_02520, partial [Bacilli bacterium]|nr:hypothetical protein [Bacilli bacterium]